MGHCASNSHFLQQLHLSRCHISCDKHVCVSRDMYSSLMTIQHCLNMNHSLFAECPSAPSQPHSSAEQSETELHSEGNDVPTDSQTVPSGARALLDVSSSPNMRDVDELLVTPVAANWQRVALRLGVEGCVSEVLLKNYPNDCEEACWDMLDRWLRRERHTGGEERTWSTLLTALGRAGFEELERRLWKEHFHQATSS